LALLRALRARRAAVAILTRNSRGNALRTLEAVALAEFFEPTLVLGRDEAPPKPDPDGVLHLARHWNVDPGRCVVVGDFLYDLQAGRAAGTYTVHVDPSGEFRFREHADLCVQRLDALLP
jgi:HAD superfamily hydrolase (TIGR01509 family)